MNKKLIDKLNQQDRLEYLLETQNNNSILGFLFCFVIFLVFTNLGLFAMFLEGIEEGKMIIYVGAVFFVIIFFLALGSEYINERKIEEKYLAKLTISNNELP